MPGASSDMAALSTISAALTADPAPTAARPPAGHRLSAGTCAEPLARPRPRDLVARADRVPELDRPTLRPRALWTSRRGSARSRRGRPGRRRCPAEAATESRVTAPLRPSQETALATSGTGPT